MLLEPRVPDGLYVSSASREHAEKQDAQTQTYPKGRIVRVEAFESANITGKLRHCYEQIEGYSVFAEDVREVKRKEGKDLC